MTPIPYHLLALAILAKCGSAYEWITGYEPFTLVSDHAAIDLDQQQIDELLRLASIDSAQNIYEKGGNSQSIARLMILNPENVTVPVIFAGAQVVGMSAAGNHVFGSLVEDLSFNSSGSDHVEALVQYPTKTMADEPHCRVGGLVSIKAESKGGCFMELGQILFQESQITLNYTYDSGDDTFNGRTIQKFSLNAKDEMFKRKEDSPYEDFTKFLNYYGEFDYGDHWIQAAFDQQATKFRNGNVDFSLVNTEGLEAAIQIGMKFMNIWMYIIRMMENAIDVCEIPCGDESCRHDAVHSWDQAVAYYSGSLEEEGVLFFAFADAMCRAFHACGIDGSLRVGTSYTNNKVLKHFREGQKYVFQGKCDNARVAKEEITKAMVIPLIQATLYTTYANISPQNADGDSMTDGVRSVSFAATVLPIVHHCSPDDATIIYENLRLEVSSPRKSSANFLAVKNAFEKNYECMGVTCEAVGGIWQEGEYAVGATPCGLNEPAKGASATLPSILILGVLLLVGGLMILLCLFCHSRRKKLRAAARRQKASDMLDSFEDAIRLPNID